MASAEALRAARCAAVSQTRKASLLPVGTSLWQITLFGSSVDAAVDAEDAITPVVAGVAGAAADAGAAAGAFAVEA